MGWTEGWMLGASRCHEVPRVGPRTIWFFMREDEGCCRQATQSPTPQEIPTDLQEVALARGPHARMHQGGRRTFGSAVNRHVHLHAYVTDGVFVPAAAEAGGDTPPAFLPARPITKADVAALGIWLVFSPPDAASMSRSISCGLWSPCSPPRHTRAVPSASTEWAAS